MTPRDRFLATLKGNAVDRVPLQMEGFIYESLDDVEDPGKKEILSRYFDESVYFLRHPSQVNRYLVTPPQRMKEIARKIENSNLITTVEIDTPKGPLTAITGTNKTSNTTWQIKYPCENRDDIEKIRSVPWELPINLKAPDLTDLPGSFSQRGIIHTGVSSPFVCAAAMMSHEYFLELCITDFELIDELTEICFHRIMDCLDILFAENTVEYVWMGGSEWLTPPMGSPELYEKLVQKYEVPIIKRIHDGGAISHVHSHGNVSSTIDMVIERGADFFEPVEPPPDGDISFAEAKKRVNGKMTLGGNIESRILEKGCVDEVDKAVKEAFEGGKERMILQTTAGPINKMDAKMIENYHRMVDIWQDYSLIS